MGGRNVYELSPPAHEPATRDLHVAAFLLARNIKLVESRLYGSRVYFFFHPGKGFDEVRAEWIGGDDRVSARAYADALRRLKQLVHEVMDNRGGGGREPA